MPGNRAALWLVPDEPDQVPRLERFRAEHPEVIILLRGVMPKAWLGGRKIMRRTLRDLLDELEEIFAADNGGSQRRSGLRQDFSATAKTGRFRRHASVRERGMTVVHDGMLTGLTPQEAAQRLAADGSDELPAAKKRNLAQQAWDVVREPMLLLLVGAGPLRRTCRAFENSWSLGPAAALVSSGLGHC